MAFLLLLSESVFVLLGVNKSLSTERLNAHDSIEHALRLTRRPLAGDGGVHGLGPAGRFAATGEL